MKLDPTDGYIYTILDWITKFAFLNVLWIVFSLMGGIIFGVFPATIAMFTITRNWATGNTELPLFKSFWEYFRSEFFRSNLLGIFVIIGLFITILDLLYIQMHGTLNWTFIPLFAFILLFGLFLFYLFPTYVHYDIKLVQVIKNAFLIMLINPINSLIMILCLLLFAILVWVMPALAFIFGGSTYAFITMHFSLKSFHKINQTH